MSQAGRYAHEQNTKRHAQRTAGSPKRAQVETIETATWMTGDMLLCRELTAKYDNSWGMTQFLAHRSVSNPVTEEEADRRLRYLSKLGFLRMGKETKDGKFVRFTFSMVNPDLPI